MSKQPLLVRFSPVFFPPESRLDDSQVGVILTREYTDHSIVEGIFRGYHREFGRNRVYERDIYHKLGLLTVPVFDQRVDNAWRHARANVQSSAARVYPYPPLSEEVEAAIS